MSDNAPESSDEIRTEAEIHPPQAESTESSSKESDSDEGHFLRYAERYAVGISLLSAVVWLWFMPWRSSHNYDLPPETDICTRIIHAEIAANPSSSDQQVPIPVGCPQMRVQQGKVSTISTLSAINSIQLRRIALESEPNTNPTVVDELLTDLNVWTRYEYELKTFEWGQDLNWYIYSTLRVLVIILSAITPALIVAPIFQKKKFLAALPAAIVAIGTGCITEFDFKNEAAAYTLATVQV